MEWILQALQVLKVVSDAIASRAFILFLTWPLLGIGIVLIIVMLLSVRIVGPTEIGIVVRMGDPRRVIGSGIHFLLPRGIDEVVRYPTTQYQLDYPVREVITTKGDYRTESHERVVLKVDITVYFRWPRNNALIEAMRTAPPPGLAQSLSDHFEDFSVGTMRSICGVRTWAEVIDNRETIREEAQNILKNNADSPFKKAEISDITLTIEEIKLPDHLAVVLTTPQEDSLRREGVEQQAKAERYFTEQQGEAYRKLGAIGPLAAFFTLLSGRKTR